MGSRAWSLPARLVDAGIEVGRFGALYEIEPLPSEGQSVCEAERAPMLYRVSDSGHTRRGALVDVHVRCR